VIEIGTALRPTIAGSRPAVGEPVRPSGSSLPATAETRDPLSQPEEAIRRVYGYVAYRIGDGAGAELVTAATMRRAARERTSYRAGEDGSPTVWLIAIARRCIADSQRADLALDTTQDPRAQAEIHRAVALLDPRARDLIALRYGAGLRSKEIAPLLDLTPRAVDVALGRTVERLRDMVEGDDRTGRAPRPSPAHP
jgi:RNA polymerase sigma-70 factor (ECF subfamily)